MKGHPVYWQFFSRWKLRSNRSKYGFNQPPGSNLMGQIQSTFWPRSNVEGEGEGKGEPPFSSLCLFNHDMYISCVTVIVLLVVLLVLLCSPTNWKKLILKVKIFDRRFANHRIRWEKIKGSRNFQLFLLSYLMAIIL